VRVVDQDAQPVLVPAGPACPDPRDGVRCRVDDEIFAYIGYACDIWCEAGAKPVTVSLANQNSSERRHGGHHNALLVSTESTGLQDRVAAMDQLGRDRARRLGRRTVTGTLPPALRRRCQGAPRRVGAVLMIGRSGLCLDEHSTVSCLSKTGRRHGASASVGSGPHRMRIPRCQVALATACAPPRS
jgi:hypothetical protein